MYSLMYSLFFPLVSGFLFACLVFMYSLMYSLFFSLVSVFLFAHLVFMYSLTQAFRLFLTFILVFLVDVLFVLVRTFSLRFSKSLL